MTKFIVDSTFAVTEEYAKKHDIRIAPLRLLLDGVESVEGYEPTWEEFYSRYEKSTSFPTTSQPSPFLFEEAIREILKENPSASIIILTIAGGLSGTVNSARLAASSFPDSKIAVIDSQNASMSEWMLLDRLLAANNNNTPFEELCTLAESLILRLASQFIPPTMKYLRKGGRIGFLGALFGDILSIKPLFDFRKNLVTVPKRIHGMKRAINEMVERLPAKIEELYIVYIHKSDYIEVLAAAIKEQRGLEDISIRQVSPVFGIHIGIGTLGICWLESE